MSTANADNHKKNEYISRIVEVCGSSQPGNIARLLNITYQAARNYLQGRLPDSSVLLIIAERTPFSIHWLLTGEGNKYADPLYAPPTPELSDEIKKIIKEVCASTLRENTRLAGENQPAKLISVPADKIKLQKSVKKDVMK